jgi:hypothetical protein
LAFHQHLEVWRQAQLAVLHSQGCTISAEHASRQVTSADRLPRVAVQPINSLAAWQEGLHGGDDMSCAWHAGVGGAAEGSAAEIDDHAAVAAARECART